MLTTLLGIWALWSAFSIAIVLLSFLLEGTEWELNSFWVWVYVPIAWIFVHLVAIVVGLTYLGIRMLLW